MVIDQILRLKYIEAFLRMRKDRGATFNEIIAYLKGRSDSHDEYKISKRTFLRDKELLHQLSGLKIDYDPSKKAYCINQDELSYVEDSFESLLLLDAYRSLKDKADILLFENRPPKGLTENLQDILTAIKEHKVISFEHQSLWNYETKPTVKKLQPYALKEFRYRWYILGQVFDDTKVSKEIKAFGLDRIRNLEVNSKTFRPDDIDIAKLYENSFGIVAPNGMEPEKITLSFDRQQGEYVKKLPLHHSQQVERETETETVISVYLVPTYDFEREILSFGHRVKVISPNSFREKIKTEIQKVLDYYS